MNGISKTRLQTAAAHPPIRKTAFCEPESLRRRLLCLLREPVEGKQHLLVPSFRSEEDSESLAVTVGDDFVDIAPKMLGCCESSLLDLP
jgi:hypothetical protein